VLRPPHTVKLCDEGIELDDEPTVAAINEAPPMAADDWQIRRRTRELGRMLRIEVGHTHSQSSTNPIGSKPSDRPHDLFDELRAATATPLIEPAGYSQPRRTPPARPESGQFIAWFVTLAGILALTAGLGALGWIITGGGMQWWNHALALTLAGQGLLILGLALVVTRLWRNSRYATGKLQVVHADLAQLQRTADAITAMRAGGAPAFYADLVRGASPQMLLANLKGQIDHLATRLGGEH
jgi:hypothetical protein